MAVTYVNVITPPNASDASELTVCKYNTDIPVPDWRVEIEDDRLVLYSGKRRLNTTMVYAYNKGRNGITIFRVIT